MSGDAWLNSTFGRRGLWVVDMAPTATPRSGFVTAVGGDLTLDGTPYTFTGMNLYNANSDGWCREAIDDDDARRLPSTRSGCRGPATA